MYLFNGLIYLLLSNGQVIWPVLDALQAVYAWALILSQYQVFLIALCKCPQLRGVKTAPVQERYILWSDIDYLWKIDWHFQTCVLFFLGWLGYFISTERYNMLQPRNLAANKPKQIAQSNTKCTNRICNYFTTKDLIQATDCRLVYLQLFTWSFAGPLVISLSLFLNNTSTQRLINYILNWVVIIIFHM